MHESLGTCNTCSGMNIKCMKECSSVFVSVSVLGGVLLRVGGDTFVRLPVSCSQGTYPWAPSSILYLPKAHFPKSTPSSIPVIFQHLVALLTSDKGIEPQQELSKLSLAMFRAS